MIQKMISIREDQTEWIADEYISLSKFVQSKIDEAIESRGERSHDDS